MLRIRRPSAVLRILRSLKTLGKANHITARRFSASNRVLASAGPTLLAASPNSLASFPRRSRSPTLDAPYRRTDVKKPVPFGLSKSQTPASQTITSTPSSNFVRHNSMLTSQIGINHMIIAAQNGILEADDYYRHGLPKSKFHLTLPRGATLDAIFKQHSHVDPFTVAANDVSSISDSIKKIMSSDVPVLHTVAKYFFEVQGKRVRPTIVCLISRAMSLIAPQEAKETGKQIQTVKGDSIAPAQRQLSEITEMIHTASLLHDDVIDEAASRRGVPSTNASFGNKLAILGGDFLLARASVMLARLRNPVVIELLSTVIEHLVKGEVMQMKPSAANGLTELDYYLTKSYYKTASLIANSCKAVAILGGHDVKTQEIAFEYGKNVGLAFQIVDDVLDFTGSSEKTGKPTHNDLQQGVATVPVLYATEQFPHLKELIARKFKQLGDVQTAIECVEKSGSIKRAQNLAQELGESAVAAVMQLPDSVPRSALIHLVKKVLTRDQ